MSDNEIINFNIPTGVPIEIKFNKYMNPLSKVYLVIKEIANKIEAKIKLVLQNERYNFSWR